MFSNSQYALIATLEIKESILDCYILQVLRWLIINSICTDNSK